MGLSPLFVRRAENVSDQDTHPAIYTIGHSNAPAEQIVTLLRTMNIEMLVDVRSVPASRYAPQFTRAAFARTLKEAGIAYVYMGDALGGRPADPTMYRDGVLPHGKANYLALVDYEKVAMQPWFEATIRDLVALARARRTAIMCSEENPNTCHRHHLVGRSLQAMGLPVYHLRHHGPIEVAPFAVVAAFQGALRLNIPRGERLMMLYTIGFTQKSAKEFFALLRDHGVQRLVDVRLRPYGQLAGFTKRDDLTYFLSALNGCDYHHVPLLAPTKEILDTYRKNGDWDEYVRRFELLMDERNVPFALDRDGFEAQASCLLCSEPTPEQCHRRLVAERIARSWAGTRIVHL